MDCAIISQCALNYPYHSAPPFVACIVNVLKAEPLILAVSYCENVYACVGLFIAGEVEPVPLEIIKPGISVMKQKKRDGQISVDLIRDCLCEIIIGNIAGESFKDESVIARVSHVVVEAANICLKEIDSVIARIKIRLH